MRPFALALFLAVLPTVSAQPCTSPADCDDGNDCTSDLCLLEGCQHAPFEGPCDDHDACTSLSWCAAGTCVGEQYVTCVEDANPCTYASCIPPSGCAQLPLPDGLPCHDANACTRNEVCLFGACIGAPVDCQPADACHEPGTCDPVTGQCAGSPSPDGTPCDDGSACTESDRCLGGSCTGGTAIDCDDGDPCTVDRCDSTDGCAHTPTTTCDDGNACTLDDRCAEGTCSGGPPPDCDDGNLCTSDTCYPAAGCVHASDHTCDGDPQGLGYWKRLCQGPIGEEKLTAFDVACVRASCTFASLSSLADLCDRLHARPPQDSCEQGEAQFVALLLNTCRGRLADTLALRSPCRGVNFTTVGAARAGVDALLCEADRDQGSCDAAECVAEEINAGRALR